MTQKERNLTSRNVDSKEKTRKKRPETTSQSVDLPMARNPLQRRDWSPIKTHT